MPETTPVRVGVVGVGVLGTHHARLYGEIAGAQLVGVYDASPDRAHEVAEAHGGQAYASIEALAADCDALSVAVPTDLHYDAVKLLLSMDKHVLVEKPLTHSAATGRELVDLAHARGLALMVGHVERFNPVITYLEAHMTTPLFIEAHRLAPYPPPRPGMKPRGTEVGVVLDLMIHDLDIILHLVKSPVERFEAVGLPILSETEDIANARITFENGCVANVTASRVSPESMRKIRVFQPDAYLSLDYGAKKGEVYTRGGFLGINREQVPIEDANALQRELESFVQCAAQAKATGVCPEPAVSGEHGLKALELAEGIAAYVRDHLGTVLDRQGIQR